MKLKCKLAATIVEFSLSVPVLASVGDRLTLTIYPDSWGKTSGSIQHADKGDLRISGQNYGTSDNDLYYELREDSLLKPVIFERRMYIGKSFDFNIGPISTSAGHYFVLNPAGPLGGAYGWGSMSDPD